MKYIFCLGIWICFVLKDIYLILCFSIIFSIYLYIRFKKKFIVLLWFLCSFLTLFFFPSYHPAEKGTYEIIEIKNKYCIARNEDTKVVVYGLDQANFGDKYQLDEFENIYSLKNIHQFNFESYMNKNNIYECTNGKENQCIKKSDSIKSYIFQKLKEKPLCLLYLYGIYDPDSINLLARLSLPFLVCMHILEKILNTIISENKTKFVCILISILYGYLFTFKIALVRYILNQIVKYLDSESFCITSTLLLFLFPYSSCDFSYILPFGLGWIQKYIKKQNKLASFIFIYSLQFIYFHEINLLALFFFSFFKNINVILFLSSFFIDISFLNIQMPVFHYVPNLIFYSLMILLFYYLIHNQIKYSILILFLCSPVYSSYLNPFFHVYTLDIGQGDCTLIVEPYKKSVVMIDCGQNLYRNNVEKIILPVLEDLQIHTIDTLIVTHEDFDHSGGKEELGEKIKINQIVEDSNEEIKVNYTFYSLLPERNIKDENDSSIVSYFQYDTCSFLWMGDASISIENQLLQRYDLDVDVLKLGHHGSRTSSSFHFLEKIDPTLGIISVGKDNKYNHPSSKVISNAHLLGIDFLMTKEEGMIHIFTLKKFTFFVTATGLFGMI